MRTSIEATSPTSSLVGWICIKRPGAADMEEDHQRQHDAAHRRRQRLAIRRIVVVVQRRRELGG